MEPGVIIGTAGHIDHGKSALVTALTGRAVDRLEEEKRRGITIDLNFAPLELPGLPPVGIIDVPGHEDLVRTMVAGASGIDLVLLVIDLVEGARPQTEEHLAILEQLAVPVGIPVFTKADLVEPDWAELVVAETAARLARSPIRFERPAIVSAHAGTGLVELRARLEAHIRAATARPTGDVFRMPIDRAFSRAGIGTIVTGTTWTGTVRVGDDVVVLPRGDRGRIRSVEAYGKPMPAARPAVRTALGIAGIDRAEIRRGDVVVMGPWEPSTALDASLTLVETAPAPLRPRTRVRVHLGTAEVLARVMPGANQPIQPGQRGVARLVLESPLVARGGDRLVLRSYSPVTTIGGGLVVDPLPPRRSRPDPALLAPGVDRAVALAARRRFGVPIDALPQLLGIAPAAVGATLTSAGLASVGGMAVPRSVLDDLATAVTALVGDHHRRAPAEPGLSVETLRSQLDAPAALTDRVLQDLDNRGIVRVKHGVASRSGFVPTEQAGPAAVAAVLRFVEGAGLEAPTLVEIARETGLDPVLPAVRAAMAGGELQAVDRERYASRKALNGFRDALGQLGREGDITPAAVRDRLGLTRKYLIPLLEWADRQGVTQRVGEVRRLVQNGR